jgi:hypothetical protein
MCCVSALLGRRSSWTDALSGKNPHQQYAADEDNKSTFTEARWLEELEQENARLKRLLAVAEFDEAALNDLRRRKW